MKKFLLGVKFNLSTHTYLTEKVLNDLTVISDIKPNTLLLYLFYIAIYLRLIIALHHLTFSSYV